MTLRAESGGKVFSQPQVARLRREQDLQPIHDVRPLAYSVRDLCDAIHRRDQTPTRGRRLKYSNEALVGLILRHCGWPDGSYSKPVSPRERRQAEVAQSRTRTEEVLALVEQLFPEFEGKPLVLRPYQIQPLVDMCGGGGAKLVSLMWSAQSGKTLLAQLALGIMAYKGARNLMLAVPTFNDITSFRSEKIDPFIESSPDLADLFSGGKNNTSLIEYGDRALYFAHSGSPSSMASRTVQVVVLDELDKHKVSRDEGGTVAQLQQRGAAVPGSIIGCISTPKKTPGSIIGMLFRSGSALEWYVRHSCSEDRYVLSWPANVRPAEDPNIGVLACHLCGGVIEERERREMIEDGEWRGRPDHNWDPRERSYRLNRLSSLETDFQDTYYAYTSAERRGEVLEAKAFILAEDATDARLDMDITEDVVRSRYVAGYGLDELPRARTAGVDVQGNRLEYSIYDWEDSGYGYLVSHLTEMLPSENNHLEITAALSSLIDHLYDDWLCDAIAVDSAFATDEVAQGIIQSGLYRRDAYFTAYQGQVALEARRPVVGIRGYSPSFERAIFMGLIQDGGKHYGLERWRIAVDELKLRLSGMYRHGAISVNEFAIPDDLPEQMTSEQVRYDSEKDRWQWIKVRADGRNETLDTGVYALAAKIWLGDRIRPSLRARGFRIEDYDPRDPLSSAMAVASK